MGDKQVKDDRKTHFLNRIRSSVLICGLGFFTACAVTSHSKNPKLADGHPTRRPALAQKHFEDGRGFVKKGDHTNAVVAFQKASKADPRFGLAYLEWASSLIFVSEDQPAIAKVLKQAADLLPTNPRARTLYGQVLLRTAKHSEAIVQLNEALRLKPSLVEPRLDLAEVFQEKGKLLEAKVQLEKVLSARADHLQARVRLGQLFAQMERYHAAAKQIEIAAEQTGASAALYRRAAKFYATAGNAEKARYLRMQADKIDPPARSRSYRPLRKARRFKGS